MKKPSSLAERRALLVATASMQRARLAHDVAQVRQASELPLRAGVVLVAGIALVAIVALVVSPRRLARAPASVWWLRGLTLWRAVRALNHLWAAPASTRR